MYSYLVFNNREISTIVWTVILFAWILLKQPTFYKNILDVLASTIKMWRYFLLMIIYISLSIFVLYKISFWDIDYIKIVVLWFFGWAIVMFVNSMKIGKEKGYLKKVILDMISLTVFISFISNFHSFSLWFELLLVPSVIMLAGMSAVSSFDQKYNLVGKFANSLLITIGLIVFCVSLYKTTIHFNDFANIGTLQEFMIPILLSLMFIPFACALALYGRCEQKRVR